MAKIPPYHTTSFEYPPGQRNVHHDHENCLAGKRIKLQHRLPGTGGKLRCKVCISLG
jgi:hypothetical protein